MSDEALKQMKDHKKLASHLHSYTHGIHSDPIALFAILFSAVIHDVDHQGISNKQLIEEFPQMGELYRNKSVAEQNSLSLAMDVLNDSHFKPMREFIFEAPEEFARFRQIVVNVVRVWNIMRSKGEVCIRSKTCVVSDDIHFLLSFYFFSGVGDGYL